MEKSRKPGVKDKTNTGPRPKRKRAVTVFMRQLTKFFDGMHDGEEVRRSIGQSFPLCKEKNKKEKLSQAKEGCFAVREREPENGDPREKRGVLSACLAPLMEIRKGLETPRLILLKEERRERRTHLSKKEGRR